VLMVPGSSLPSDSFVAEFTHELRGVGLRVVHFDQRDTGRSTRTPEGDDYTLVDMAADAIAVLDTAEIETAHLVTYSLGGAIATLLALSHPHRVGAVTTLGAPSPDMSLGLGPGATDPGYFGAPEDVVEAMIRNFGDHTLDDEAWLRAEVARWSDRAGRWSLAVPQHMAAAFRTTPPTRDAMATVARPFLVIHGELDNEIPLAHAHTLAEWLPNVTLEVVPGLGHIPTASQWRDIGTRVARFLTSSAVAAAL
jgi:pimeloyl-ACP methyl ester carboxylesterase